jgi:hypothetical protein
MDFREIGWERLDWIRLDQGRDPRWALVNTVLNLRFPETAGKFLSI